MSDLIEQTIHHYTIKQLIGKGGHGTVYLAEDINTGELVALKILLPKRFDDIISVQRFRQEIEIIRDLRHPHIVPMIETWEDDTSVYLITPYLGGGDLRQRLTEITVFKPNQLQPILYQICSALDACHATQIIHRDIKPENILLDRHHNAYLTDFGFAKRRENSNFSTTAGTIIGSPKYLSPEQILGDTVTNRTDIFVIGILIYEMLSGVHPFGDTNSRMQMMVKLAQDNLPELVIDHISEKMLHELNELIQRCTSKDPSKRYLTASSVAYHFSQIFENYHNIP